MQRIATTNKAPDLFGAGKDGFRDGNPSGGVYATEFSALWCNQAQEELLTLIEAADLTPSDTDNTQIWQALVALYGAGRPGHVYTANDWCPVAGGLILQWGGFSVPSVPAGGSSSVNVTLPDVYVSMHMAQAATVNNVGLANAQPRPNGLSGLTIWVNNNYSSVQTVSGTYVSLGY